jgi:hypothetical protein
MGGGGGPETQWKKVENGTEKSIVRCTVFGDTLWISEDKPVSFNAEIPVLLRQKRFRMLWGVFFFRRISIFQEGSVALTTGKRENL